MLLDFVINTMYLPLVMRSLVEKERQTLSDFNFKAKLIGCNTFFSEFLFEK